MIKNIIISLPSVLLAIGVHEAAHGFMADRLGDKTARMQGRLTLNPLAHIDFLGMASMLLFGFGWAKPVPINPNNFKNRNRDVALTALAGPLSNIILAAICIFLFGIISKFNGEYISVILTLLSITASINVGFAIFNMLPIPPFDGSRVIFPFLPQKAREFSYRNEQTIQFILFALLFMGFLDNFLFFMRSGVLNFLQNIIL